MSDRLPKFGLFDAPLEVAVSGLARGKPDWGLVGGPSQAQKDWEGLQSWVPKGKTKCPKLYAKPNVWVEMKD